MRRHLIAAAVSIVVMTCLPIAAFALYTASSALHGRGMGPIHLFLMIPAGSLAMALVSTALAAAVSLVLDRGRRRSLWPPLLWAFASGFFPALLGGLSEESLRTSLEAALIAGALFAVALGAYWIPFAVLGPRRTPGT